MTALLSLQGFSLIFFIFYISIIHFSFSCFTCFEASQMQIEQKCQLPIAVISQGTDNVLIACCSNAFRCSLVWSLNFVYPDILSPHLNIPAQCGFGCRWHKLERLLVRFHLHSISPLFLYQQHVWRFTLKGEKNKASLLTSSFPIIYIIY